MKSDNLLHKWGFVKTQSLHTVPIYLVGVQVFFGSIFYDQTTDNLQFFDHQYTITSFLTSSKSSAVADLTQSLAAHWSKVTRL